MAYYKILKRSLRIRMFLHEYYYCHSLRIILLRILAGPLLIMMGGYLVSGSDNLGIAFGGFLLFYGGYFSVKPFIWLLFRPEAFRTVKINIVVNDDILILENELSESLIPFKTFQRIWKRSYYYALEIAQYDKIYLPFAMLSEAQLEFFEQSRIFKLNQAKSAGNLI